MLIVPPLLDESTHLLAETRDHGIIPPPTMSTPGPALQTPPDSIIEVDPKESDQSTDNHELGQKKQSQRLGFVSTISKDEPIVTRRELWSYYCESEFY